MGFYSDPAVYDILHAPGTAAEVDAHEKIERALMPGRLKKRRLWFEPACGSGRYLKVAAGRGRGQGHGDHVAGPGGQRRKQFRRRDLALPAHDHIDPGKAP